MSELIIRSETPEDTDQVFAIVSSAFPTDAEARLVDLLRERGNLLVSLVAVHDESVAGHIAFSPVTVGDSEFVGAGLAPVAVRPSLHRQGVGSRLIRDGLERCQKNGVPFAVVLGEPDYYQRFGFTPAREFDLVDEYGGGDAFMAIELRPGALENASGLVRYSPEFAEL